mmetsp:Transcript_14062/g.21483  ORF Transcript_14062/g.21483 Transcript_14062/m.21483 type:complete len:168 (-) Transcript_14062:375-878(-)
MSDNDTVLQSHGTLASNKAVDSFVDESSDVVPDEVIIEFLDHLNEANQEYQHSKEQSGTHLPSSLTPKKDSTKIPRDAESTPSETICYASATLLTSSEQVLVATPTTTCNVVQAVAVHQQQSVSEAVDMILTAQPCTWWERNLWRITAASLSINVMTISFILFGMGT